MTNTKEVLNHYHNEREQKVRNMEPGPELDTLVAEKVMGWVYVPSEFVNHYITKDHFVDPKTGEAHFDWSPSTDIRAAWDVVEKTKSMFWEMNLDTGSKDPRTSVTFYKTYDSKFRYQATGYTAPEAITKAALLAVMEGEGE